MKVLIVSNVQTHPTTSGSAKFISDYCNLLKHMGHDVYFLHVTYYMVTRANRELSRSAVITTRQQWGNHYFHYQMTVWDKASCFIKGCYHKYFTGYFAGCDDRYAIGLHRFVNRLDSKLHFDACMVNYYWLSKLLTKITIPRKGIITHDSFTYNNLRNNVKSLLNLHPNEEAKALQRCPTIFAMQDEEAILFKRLAPQSRILKSYCNYEYFEQKIVHNHNLLFLSGSFYLNINGLRWFIEEIFPNIMKRFPDCRLKIGGTICENIQEYNGRNNVDLLGFIENAADFYALGDVAINPTYQGTGLKIKTFEAMAYDKVIMAHPHSVNGIYQKDEAPIFYSTDPYEWVVFLEKIWGDKSAITEIKKRNQEYISKMNAFVKSQFEEFLK